jgi:hypothetical protein
MMPVAKVLGVTAIVVGAPVFGQSTACVVPASNRSVPGGVVATLWPLDPDAPDTAYTAQLLMAIGEAYHPREALTLGDYSVPGPVATASAYTVVEFTRTKAGRVEKVELLATSLSPAFDRAVVDAVDSAGASGLPPLPRVSWSLHYRLDVALVPGGRDTTSSSARPPGSMRLLWLGTSIPMWNGATAPEVVAGSTPLYPEAARRDNGVEDSLVVRFTIGPNGRVTPGTAVVLHGTYREFAESIGLWLRKKTYRPAAIGGCPVPSVALESFKFKIVR